MNMNNNHKNCKPDIFKCIVKYYIPDEEWKKAVDIKLVAAHSMGEAVSIIEDYYGDEMASVDIEPICETTGVYNLGYIEDEDVIEDMFTAPEQLPGFKPEI